MRRGLSLLACFLCLTGMGDGGYPLNQGYVGHWQTFTWMTDADQFVYCAAGQELRSGGQMLISMGVSGMVMSVDVQGQHLVAERPLTINLHVLEKWHGRYDAQVLGEPGANTLLVRFGWDTAAFEALRRGPRLTLSTPDFGYDYDLRGSDTALTHIGRCADHYLYRGEIG